MKNTSLRANLLAIGIAVAATFSAALVPATSWAYDENSASAVNVDTKGVGLRGHDPVAYFTAGAPTLGNSSFTAKHNGVTFHFASAANREGKQQKHQHRQAAGHATAKRRFPAAQPEGA